ncbi:ribosomal protein S5 domain 2-type protein [Apiosordaria backusii]|uniref:Phosphomevalonate kinase n=1 Tax=Apiosordaria backusii TaxID=314023 RepID=A0AA40BL35_9PEZI|nr:ribosomal protein S5 domain 2-type protein [Apiosordaria backusii]
MPEHKKSSVVSAPGKVLLAGGYIVLDREYSGLVFGLSARINVVSHPIQSTKGVHLTEIVVESPQFDDDSWVYGYTPVEGQGGVKVTQLDPGNKPFKPNHFVETTLNYVLSYIVSLPPKPTFTAITPAKFTILADNDYYSTSSSSSSPSARHRFRHLGQTISKANKTGLGSSAALVTSLTGCLLSHYLPLSVFNLSTPSGRQTLHNLSQAAHCAAQGKIGSGFDVASAVYGSCIYRRFSPSLLSSLPTPGTKGFGKAVVETVHSPNWDQEINKEETDLAGGYKIRMVDVTGGTATVSMVKLVNAWREKNRSEADELFSSVETKMKVLAQALKQGDEPAVKQAMGEVRKLMKTMGEQSGAEIEPDSQTKMLDELEGLEGVVGSVVPGAGGYDAAALVIRDDEVTVERVKKFLEEYSRREGVKARLLDVLGEVEGARLEGWDGTRWEEL